MSQTQTAVSQPWRNVYAPYRRKTEEQRRLAEQDWKAERAQEAADRGKRRKFRR